MHAVVDLLDDQQTAGRRGQRRGGHGQDAQRAVREFGGVVFHGLAAEGLDQFDHDVAALGLDEPDVVDVLLRNVADEAEYPLPGRSVAAKVVQHGGEAGAVLVELGLALVAVAAHLARPGVQQPDVLQQILVAARVQRHQSLRGLVASLETAGAAELGQYADLVGADQLRLLAAAREVVVGDVDVAG